MAKLIGICGSLRRDSFNKCLLEIMAKELEARHTIEIHTLHGIALYDGDDETQEGLPLAVQKLKDAFEKADGVVIASPEYNRSISGVLKNAIDWMSRPPADIKKIFSFKKVAICGASTGLSGTRYAQIAFLPIAQVLNIQLWNERLLGIDNAAKVFDMQKRILTSEDWQKKTSDFINLFANFVHQK